MNHAQYDAFMERKRNSERAHHCKHGHLDCSDRDDGPCCDEEHPIHHGCHCPECRDLMDEKDYDREG